jgi:hypothetical protein
MNETTNVCCNTSHVFVVPIPQHTALLISAHVVTITRHYYPYVCIRAHSHTVLITLMSAHVCTINGAAMLVPAHVIKNHAVLICIHIQTRDSKLCLRVLVRRGTAYCWSSDFQHGREDLKKALLLVRFVYTLSVILVRM